MSVGLSQKDSVELSESYWQWPVVLLRLQGWDCQWLRLKVPVLAAAQRSWAAVVGAANLRNLYRDIPGYPDLPRGSLFQMSPSNWALIIQDMPWFNILLQSVDSSINLAGPTQCTSKGEPPLGNKLGLDGPRSVSLCVCVLAHRIQTGWGSQFFCIKNHISVPWKIVNSTENNAEGLGIN